MIAEQEQAEAASERRGYEKARAEMYAVCGEFGHFVDFADNMEYVCDCGETFHGAGSFQEHQQTMMAQRALQGPCEWEDLRGLAGRALRERLRGRSDAYRMVARYAEAIAARSQFPSSKADLMRLAGVIYDMEQALTREAERLWQEEAGQ